MESITVTELNIYPIKSLAGISLKECDITDRGLKYDRRWMLVDDNNHFISQRKFSKLCLLNVSFSPDTIRIAGSDFGNIDFDIHESTGREINVTVWESSCHAVEVSKKANEYFSAFLNKNVTLVYMPEESKRLVDTNYASTGDIVSFADGFPLLLIGEASLEDLNSRLKEPVPMSRFRPNIVVGTSVPFDEDSWENFTIGNTNFKAVKPCARCIMTTIDRGTGKTGSEPLKTLSKYRSVNNKVMFGQNVLIGEGSHKIKCGDSIFVSSRRKI